VSDRASVCRSSSQWSDGVYSYASGRGTQDTYDDQGDILSESAPGNTAATTYTYNTDGSVAQQDDPDGSFVAYSYDQNGNMTSQTVPMSGYSSQTNSPVATTNYTYDYANRLTSTTEPDNFATSNTYDELSRLTGAQGSGSSEAATNTVYNNLGWVLQKVDEDGVTDSKTYDTHGNVVSETIGSKTTTSTYNADNQLLTQTDADGNVLTNTYDPSFGNLTEAKHTNGSTTLKDIVTSYDSLGRPSSQTDNVTGLSHSWSYPVNSATGVQETINYDSTPLTSVAINRDARNMETSRVATIGSGNTVTWAIADPSGRDNADRWVAATLQQTGGTQLSESRSFDGAGRLASQSGAGYTSGNSATYTYDSGPGGVNTTGTGLLDYASLPLALGGTVTEGTSSAPITYDANQRISTASVNGVAGSYSFDSAGNLKADTEGSTTTNFTYNGANQLTQSVTGSNTTVYGWDTTNAWRTSQGPSGNPTQIQYAYNAQGRMKSYSNSATGVSATYTYDAAGQRTQSAVTVGGVTTTTTWVYDGLALMSQQVVQGSSSWRVDYLYNENGLPIGGVYRSPATSTSPVFFATITNSHGDVCELLDENGNAFAAYHYDAWGLPQGAGNYATGIWTASTSIISSTLAGQIASDQVLRYASYVYDPESGLYYCSARYYDPVTRQWTTADSAKANGEESPYQYCGDRPIGNVDDSGLYAHAFVPTAYADQTRYFQKVMEVDAGRVLERLATLPAEQFCEWFYESVETHGAWDLKWCMGHILYNQENKVFGFRGRRISLDNFGNIHFGYIAAAAGISKHDTSLGALIIDIKHKKSIGKTYGDEQLVDEGWNLFWVHHACIRADSQINRFICPGFVTVLNYPGLRWGSK
jgi:RHS repeat-associated protein